MVYCIACFAYNVLFPINWDVRTLCLHYPLSKKVTLSTKLIVPLRVYVAIDLLLVNYNKSCFLLL